MIRFRSPITLILSLFSLVSFAGENNTAHITVFIHGSVHCHLLMLSPQAVWKDTISEDAWYLKMLYKVRQNPLLWQTRPMLEMGPRYVSQEMLDKFENRQLTERDASLAIYPVVAAYDALARYVDTDKKDHHYYTYGHLGLLSQIYRKEVGKELYKWLVDLVAHYKSNYRSVEVDIVAHSHGGNIALWLGHYESTEQKGLHIDNLVMYGTPLQVETFEFAYKPVFGRVFNRYSDGDHVQGNDRMSTVRGKSYKKFSDSRLPVHYQASQVYDVRLLVNKNNKIVGHGNMYLMDESHAATQTFHPAPLLVFTPAILAACRDVALNDFDCNIVDTPQAAYVEILSDGNMVARTNDFRAIGSRCTQLIKYNWQPDYSARLRSKPARLGRITLDAIRDLWNGGAIKKEEMPKLIARL